MAKTIMHISLNMLHQEHIAAHMKTLSEAEQLAMVKQIEGLDLSVLNADETNEERGTFASLFATTLSEIEKHRERFTDIIDEAQYIKNHSTAASKSVKLIHSKYRFALTGTPIENRLSELWSIFD